MATNAGFVSDGQGEPSEHSDAVASREIHVERLKGTQNREKECESDCDESFPHETKKVWSKSTAEDPDSREEKIEESSKGRTSSANDKQMYRNEGSPSHEPKMDNFSIVEKAGATNKSEKIEFSKIKSVQDKQAAGSSASGEGREEKTNYLRNLVNFGARKITSTELEKNSQPVPKSLGNESESKNDKCSKKASVSRTETKSAQPQGRVKYVTESRKNPQLNGNCASKSGLQSSNILASHKGAIWGGTHEEDGLQKRFSFDARKNSYTLSKVKGRKWLSGRPYQTAVTLMMACGTIAAGTVLAFPSVIMPDLQKNPYNVYGSPMVFSDTEKDLIASLTSLGAVVGVATSAVLTRYIGKINTMRLIAVAGVVSWVGIATAPYTWVILALRVLNGAMNGGVAMTGVSYIVEICDDVMRGPLTLVASISLYLGQSVGVMPAYWLRYYGVACVNCLYPVVFIFFATFFMPPSPSALVLIGREEDARKHLLRLRTRGADVDAQIQSYVELNEAFQNIKLIDSLKNKSVIKNLWVVFVLFVIQNCSGYPVFSVQTARVLQYSGSTIDPTTGTIVVQAAQMVGVVLAMLCVTRLGRRGTLMVSQGIMGLSICAMAVYVHLNVSSPVPTQPTDDYANATRVGFGSVNATRVGFGSVNATRVGFGSVNATEGVVAHNVTFEGSQDWITEASTGDPRETGTGWVPLVCLMFALMACSFGLQNIPMILSSEYFPTAIRSQASCMSVMLASLMRMLVLQFYSPMLTSFTQVGLLAFYSASCLVSLPFTFFYINETLGQQLG